MVRLLIGCAAITAGCYHPSPATGVTCGADRVCPDPLICRPSTMTCETSGDTIDAPVVDAISPLDVHLQASPGWTIRVLADLTGAVPYNANDFTDGVTTMEVHDNAPNGISALYAPFTASFAVTAGRSIIEVSATGATMVHDYRPAVPDMMGPDNIYRLAFGAPADTGPNLWAGAASLNGGDGVYRIDETWTLKRDNVLNNISGLSFDPAGVFDATTVPVIYFIDQAGFERRDTAGTHTLISPGSSDHDDIAITKDAIYSAFYPMAGGAQLVRIASATHAVTTIDTATTAFDVAEGGPITETGVLALRDETDLVTYADDGTSEVGAKTTDPDWHWRDVTRPQPPHPLAGTIVIVESNRTLDVDRLLVVTPP
ncbi:MAG TPA: hypothetical protein VGO00_11090 [Kofleriaceae bacterium]|nr:hypothetical protein [Kofleriaceae bacterium]